MIANYVIHAGNLLEYNCFQGIKLLISNQKPSRIPELDLAVDVGRFPILGFGT